MTPSENEHDALWADKFDVQRPRAFIRKARVLNDRSEILFCEIDMYGAGKHWVNEKHCAKRSQNRKD